MLRFTMKECKLIKGGHTFGQKCKMTELESKSFFSNPAD